MSVAINFDRLGIYKGKVSFHKVTGSFNRVVVQGYVNYFNCFITTANRAKATKLGLEVTYYNKL